MNTSYAYARACAWILSTGISCAFLSGCGQFNTTDPFKTDFQSKIVASVPEDGGGRMSLPLSEWDQRHWLEKTARALRNGAGLGTADNVNQLMMLSREQVVDKFMQDARFGDTILSFNLYFLGNQLNYLRDNKGNYRGEVFNFPHAVAAAKAVIENGDYFSLFDLEQPMYLPTLTEPSSQEKDKGKTSVEKRQILYGEIQGSIDRLIKLVEEKPSITATEFCPAFQKETMGQGQFFQLGLPLSIAIFPLFAQDWYGLINFTCNPGPAGLSSAKIDFLKALQEIKAKNQKFLSKLRSFEPDSYRITSVSDIKAIDTSDMKFKEKWSQFSFVHGQNLPNSSTNYDRKRAAYILKHFFCDDLTPINVALPKEHTMGKHGSDPACFACHYKLDPMAGFFKDHGIFFENFSDYPIIVFDDQVVTDRTTYTASWKSISPKREWNVGYVRSSDDESRNDYGVTLQDLFTIIRRAPEAKQCVVKRMFEYFVGLNQTIDAGYMDYVVGAFIKNTAVNSADAFKKTVKQILLSSSFSAKDPVSDQCYDYKPGFTSKDAPPCQVAFLLRNNCATCHGTSTHFAGLDLTKWVVLPDGSHSFQHLDLNGVQQPALKTFEKITERLTSTDTNRRMPLGQFIGSGDREKIYLWANDILKQLSQVK